MITATKSPRLWRSEFVLEHSSTSQSTIVCYLYLVDSGIRIYYSHHELRSRGIPKGHWDPPTKVRQSLNAALKALIEAGLLNAVWSEMRTEDIRMLPTDDLNMPAEELDLGL